MKAILALCAAVLFSSCLCFGQQSPPADGVGLGNDHLSPNSTDSNVPSMSPDQNSVMTDSNGSVSGDKGTPAFAGSPGADTATRSNAQGTAGVSSSTSATAARRESYKRSGAVQNTRPGTTQNSSATEKKKSAPASPPQ